MNETYGQKSKRETSWGDEESKELRTDANSSQDARRVSEGDGTQRLQPNRESSKEGIGLKSAIGGILDQLLEDAKKQLVKSRECIVWYREEAKEYEQKIENLRKLKELQEQEPEKIDQDDKVSLEE